MGKRVHVQILNPRDHKLIIVKAKQREKIDTAEKPGYDAGDLPGGGTGGDCAIPICRETYDVAIIPCQGIPGGTGVLAAPLAATNGRVLGPLLFEQAGSCYDPPDNLLMKTVQDAWFDGILATKEEDYFVSGGQLCPTVDLNDDTHVTARFEIG